MTNNSHKEVKFVKIRNFELIKEINGGCVSADYESKIVKIDWDGKVEVETAREILSKAADMIEAGHCDKLLLNRKELKEFSTEARLWIKEDLLKNRARKLVKYVHKVATVSSKTVMGGIFANFISAGIQLVFPKLKMHKFDTESEAMDWLLESEELIG